MCWECDAGKFASTIGTTACANCASGYKSDKGDAVCTEKTDSTSWYDPCAGAGWANSQYFCYHYAGFY